MNLLDPLVLTLLVALLAGVLYALRWRRRASASSRAASERDALDTVQSWPPQSARIMTIHERQAYELLRRALPGFMVLAQVPISRFLRVPTRHSYREWMQRVGALNADLLLCDAGSRVLAVIDVRSPQESERSRRRHERLARVLNAADIRVLVWREGALPTLSDVRSTLLADFGPADAAPKPTPSRPMPLIPVGDIQEVLAAGDGAFDTGTEPVPSSFFDDLDGGGAAQASNA